MDTELPTNAAEKKPRVRKPRALGAEKKPRTRKAKPVTAEEPKHEEKTKHAEKHSPLLAVIRVRGLVGINRDIEDTLRMLRLDRVNHCVIVPKNPNFEGMAKKAAYFVTWGEINQETLEKLIAKRGRFAGDKRISDENYVKELAQLMLSGKAAKDTGIKPVFRLSPPSKGYKHTKVLFPRGALGYRGEKINELLKRMI